MGKQPMPQYFRPVLYSQPKSGHPQPYRSIELFVSIKPDTIMTVSVSSFLTFVLIWEKSSLFLSNEEFIFSRIL